MRVALLAAALLLSGCGAISNPVTAGRALLFRAADVATRFLVLRAPSVAAGDDFLSIDACPMVEDRECVNNAVKVRVPPHILSQAPNAGKEGGGWRVGAILDLELAGATQEIVSERPASAESRVEGQTVANLVPTVQYIHWVRTINNPKEKRR